MSRLEAVYIVFGISSGPIEREDDDDDDDDDFDKEADNIDYYDTPTAPTIVLSSVVRLLLLLLMKKSLFCSLLLSTFFKAISYTVLTFKTAVKQSHNVFLYDGMKRTTRLEGDQ